MKIKNASSLVDALASSLVKRTKHGADPQEAPGQTFGYQVHQLKHPQLSDIFMLTGQLYLTPIDYVLALRRVAAELLTEYLTKFLAKYMYLTKYLTKHLTKFLVKYLSI